MKILRAIVLPIGIAIGCLVPVVAIAAPLHAASDCPCCPGCPHCPKCPHGG